MLSIDKISRTPIYEQIIEQFEEFVMTGVFAEEAQVPSVRTLSQRLSVNPNTLQKAYAELERRGVCASSPGNGRFVAKGAVAMIRARGAERMGELRELTAQLAAMGVDKALLIRAIEEEYEKFANGEVRT